MEILVLRLRLYTYVFRQTHNYFADTVGCDTNFENFTAHFP